MTEHLLFLQAAGTGFNTAHDLVAAVAEIFQTPHGDAAPEDFPQIKQNQSGPNNGLVVRRPGPHPERLAERLKHAGCEGDESLIVALSVFATIASPLRTLDIDWITSVAARVGSKSNILEAAGVIFAFNTINRIADARRVRLEYSFLRELKPIRGWIERRLVALTRLAYDLSFTHHSSQSAAQLEDRLQAVLEKLGLPVVPEVFNWLSQSPIVLEGILEMIESNIMNASVRSDLLKEAIAIGVISRAMPGSDLRKAVEHWLPKESLSDSKAFRTWAAPQGVASDEELVSACRRHSWQVANTAYSVTDEQLKNLSALGLSDAEQLDLTLATSVFSALAIIEPISVAMATKPIAAEKTLPSTQIHEVKVQLV